YVQVSSTWPDEFVLGTHDEYVGAPPRATRLPPGLSWDDVWRIHVTTIRKAARITEDAGLLLLIEPRVNCLVANVDAFLRLADQIPTNALAISLDFVQTHRVAEDVPTAIRKCAERLARVELADALDCSLARLPLGAAVLDWPE